MRVRPESAVGWCNSIAANGVAFDAQGIHLSVGDFLAGGVLAALQHRPHGQAAAGGCAADEGQQGVPGP